MLDRMRYVIVAALVGAAVFSGAARASLAQLSPPPNWSPAAAGATERGMFRAAAANGEAWLQATVRTNAALNVGGQLTKVPAGFRLAVNAGRFAVRAAWINPVWFAVGAVAVPLLLDWFVQNSFEWDDANKRWVKRVDGASCTSGCYDYTVSGSGNLQHYYSQQEACNAAAIFVGGSYGVLREPDHMFCYTYRGNGTYINGWGVQQYSIPPYNNSSTVPTTQTEMENAMSPLPMPDSVANELGTKDVALPVGDPVLNPSPLPEFLPKPLVVPQGLPQPIPGTDPLQYKQPQLKISPAPTADSPWQVDVTPQEETDTDPTKLTLDPKTQPEGTTTAQVTPKDQDLLDLCQKHPDILACQKLGDVPEADKLSSKEVTVAITPDGGWDLGGSSCPAARSVNLATWGGRSVQFSLQPICDFATGVRPVVVGVAWLVAVFSFFNIGRRSS